MELGDDAIRSIVAHLAHMRAEHGEVLDGAEVVLPTSEFFPDEFKVDPQGIERLMQRMATYTPLPSELELALGFIQPEDEPQAGGGCGTGACAPGDSKGAGKRHAGAVETETGYGILVHVSDANDPKILTASLARSLGRVVLFAADEEVDPRNEGALAELTAVACGLGAILLGGAAVYKKGCGGMRMHQGTFLGIEELALAVALFVRVRDEKAGSVKKHLDITQREAFDAALEWVDSQPKLVRALTDAPETLTDGIFDIESKKGLLSRFLTSRKKDDEAPDSIPISKRPAKSEEELRRLAEVKALVDEALQDS
jgi:hypothetical protein